MSVTLKSEDFLRLLKTTKITAYSKPKDDPVLASAHLMTINNGADGQLLVATSSDGINHGQTSVPCSGELEEPLLLDLAKSAWVTSMITTAEKAMRELEGRNAECSVELSVESNAGGGTHTKRLRVQTLTDGFPGEMDSFGIMALRGADDYQIEDIMRDMQGVRRDRVQVDGRDLTAGEMVPWSAGALTILGKIGNAVGERLDVYPTGHPAARRLVTCGEYWRGSVAGQDYPHPDTPNVLVDVNEPPVSFYGLGDAAEVEAGMAVE